MANYSTLISQITTAINTNGQNLITGASLQAVLLQMVGELGQAGYIFGGVVNPGDSPASSDSNLFYVAAQAGTYTNFNGLVVGAGEVAFFYFNGNAWAKSSVDVLEVVNSLTSTATDKALSAAMGKQIGDNISQLGQEVDDLQVDLYGYTSHEILDTTSPIAGTLAGGKWMTNGGYGYWLNAVLSVAEYRGRTLRITPRTASDQTTYFFTKDNTLEHNTNVNLCDGWTGTVAVPVVTDIIIPGDAGYLVVRLNNTNTSANKTPQSLLVLAQEGDLDKKVDKVAGKGLSTNDYTNEDKAKVGSISGGKFGVKWSLTNIDDLGQRTFGAVGLAASIGVGNTDGSSDFDNVWPWAGIKRCNIKPNENGANIVTFEGETGFALDGSNGDVFVRIPKFKTDHYIADGYEHIVIGDGYVHPAFIEDGAELDEIFVGAFEASGNVSALYSKSAVIPANSMTGAEFLAAAKARGNNYTLYDMRTVDAIWRLMAVEFGCRNSNRIFGYGYADYRQADTYYAFLIATVAAQATNTIVCGTITSNSLALVLQTQFAPGNVVNISDTTQGNIVAQRKIIAVSAVNGSNLTITFDGAPIDITTSMFVGNAPIFTNYCEEISEIDASYALSWHTGRTNRPILAGSGMDVETINTCRYRWIENPVGNVWHTLPDVTFYNGQMYVCRDMKDYEMLKHTSPYVPVGPVLPIQSSNGNKSDVNTTSTPNYWITGLLNDIFAKGNDFAKSFDTVHDGSLTSKKGFGGYYYLKTGARFIVNGGGFDHLWRCNILTNRAWQDAENKWFLYGARLLYKNIN